MALFQLHWLEPILQYCTKLANFSLMSGMFPTKAISSAEIMSCPRPSQKCVEEVAIGISFQDEAYNSVLGSKWVLTQGWNIRTGEKAFPPIPENDHLSRGNQKDQGGSEFANENFQYAQAAVCSMTSNGI